MAKKTLSRKQEDHLAEVIPNAERVSSSGAKRESHDVQTRPGSEWRFRYEAKCTQKKSSSFKLEGWKDLVRDVYSRGSDERPAWAVRFYGEGEDAPVLQDLVVVDLNDWVELLHDLEWLWQSRTSSAD